MPLEKVFHHQTQWLEWVDVEVEALNKLKNFSYIERIEIKLHRVDIREENCFSKISAEIQA